MGVVLELFKLGIYETLFYYAKDLGRNRIGI